MNDDLENLLNDEAEAPEVEAETVEEPAVEEAPETVEAKTEEKTGEKTEEMVPLSAHLAQRREIQAQRDYWQQLAQQSAKPTPAAEPEFDVLAEPDRLGSYVEQKVQAATQKVAADMSFNYAARVHGKDAVNAAIEAVRASSDVAFRQSLVNSTDPYGEAVEWKKRQDILAEVGTDPAAYRARIEQEVLAKIAAERVVTNAKGTPPGSLAADTNLGARTQQDDQGDYDLAAILG